MFRHCVLLKFTDKMSADELHMLVTELNSLPSFIPEIETYIVGTDLGLADTNYAIAVVADFANQAAYEVYKTHPEHVRVIEDHLRPHLADRAAIQHGW